MFEGWKRTILLVPNYSVVKRANYYIHAFPRPSKEHPLPEIPRNNMSSWRMNRGQSDKATGFGLAGRTE